MKKVILFTALVIATQLAFAQYKVVTVIESIIPMGMGRSRMIEATTEVDYNAFTTLRTDGKDTKQGDVDRGDIKVAGLRETKMLNYFSGVGINFQNIASNDAMIAARIMELESEGYSLVYVTSAVESFGGKDDDSGIFISRMYFKKVVPMK